MRGFLLGLVLLTVLSVTILSLRPGGLRRQLRFAARRLRIVLVLGGIYVIGSGIIRATFSQGTVTDYAPAALAIVLAAVFMVVGRDPASTEPKARMDDSTRSGS
jgi:hypothetical protein